jgi:hypothetical protein
MTIHASAPDRLLEMGSSYRRAKVLLSAIELDVFTILAGRSLDAAGLKQALGLHHRGAQDFLDALVALELLERSPDDHYSNAPDASAFLNRNEPSFLGGTFDQFNKREYEMWNALSDALRTGRPQTGIDEAEHFATLYRDPIRFQTFVNAMTAGSLPAAHAIAAKFPWADYQTAADIGAAQGCLAVQVARAHRHIAITGFDLPELRGAFEAYALENDVSARVQFRPGNFFHDDLPEADVLVFGRVLHNWDLSTKRMLLNKAYQALPIGGAVIVYDTLIDDDRRECAGLLSSLNMLLWTSSGFGYSGAAGESWMRESGFRETRTERLAAGQSMIIGKK